MDCQKAFKLAIIVVLILTTMTCWVTTADKVIVVDAKDNVTLVVQNTTIINSTVKTENIALESSPSSTSNVSTKRPNGPPSKYSPYFGMEFSPYVRSDGFPRENYPMDEIKKLLKIILTKSHSILTYEMGYTEEDYSGPYDTTSPSVIPIAAANLNAEAGFLQISMSQGCGILSDYTVNNQPDIEAALNMAQKANSIFPHTVWSITFSPGYTSMSGNGHVIDATTGRVAITQIQKYARRAHEINLKVGVWVDLCSEILQGDNERSVRKMLISLANVTDYFVCSVYPSLPISEAQDYFNAVRSQFELILNAWKRSVPSLEIILQTGWASAGQSNYNPAYLNSPKKTKLFWDLMGKWAEENKVRIFMHEAFDILQDADAHSGYWKRVDDNSDNYIDKGTGQLIKL